MKRYWAYFKYICYHKWCFAIVAYKLPIPMLSIITHDLSKFLPSEFFPYARAFYTIDGKSSYTPSSELELAWSLHQHRNNHHHNHWTYVNDAGEIISLDMPDEYLFEMVADWIAMELSSPENLSAVAYYLKIKDTFKVSEWTYRQLEYMMLRYTSLKYNNKLGKYCDGALNETVETAQS